MIINFPLTDFLAQVITERIFNNIIYLVNELLKYDVQALVAD